MYFLSSLALIAATVLTSLYFAFDYNPKGQEKIINWTKSIPYSEQFTSVIEKDPNKDFTILNIADLHVSDFEGPGENKKTKDLLQHLIDITNPDLITLTGDQIWTDHSKNALLREIRWLESFEIPWAPVFGNHDNEGTANLVWQSTRLEDAKHCLYKRGPSNIGPLGNYVVNIEENGKIFKSLYMLNLGTDDNFTQEQIDFVEWNANGNKAKNNNVYPEGMCFFHKAINAFNKAWRNYQYDNSIAIGDVYRSFYIADSDCGNEFFEMAKSINVTDIVCGHQHGNHFTIPYEGVRLTFALKTGDNVSIYEDDENPDAYIVGATSITLSGDNVTFTSNYVGKEYTLD